MIKGYLKRRSHIKWPIILLLLIFIYVCGINESNAQDIDSLQVEQLLTLSLDKLVEMEVSTSARFEQKAWEASSKVLVITKAMITNRGYFDLTDALKDLPYFQIQSEYGHWMKGAIVNLRGHRSGDSGNNKFLILIDGVKLSDEAEEGLYMGLNSIPLNNVKQIEIVYGPNSTLYGRDAYAGMINIVTVDSNSSYGNYSLGSFNTHRINGGVTRSLNEKTFVSLHYSSYKSDEQNPIDKSVTYKNRHVFPKHPYTEKFYRGTRNSSLDFAFKLNGFMFKFLQSDIEASETYGCNPDFYVSEYSTVTALQNRIIATQYSSNLSRNTNITFTAAFKNHEMDPKTANLYTADLGRTGSIDFADSTINIDSLYAYGGRKYYYFRTRTYSFGAKLVYQPLIKVKLTSGVESNFINGIPIISEGKGGKPITTEKQRDRWEHRFNTTGAYTEATWQIKPNLIATLGGRYDIASDYGNSFMPRLALVTRNEQFLYKLTFAQGYLAPSVTQRYFESLTTFSWIKPNPNLVSEKNTSVEVDGTFLAKDFQVSANVFYNRVLDGIVESFQTGDSAYITIGNTQYFVPIIQSMNLSSGHKYGFSLETTTKLFSTVDISANYTMLMGFDRIADEDIDLKNNLSSTHTVNLNIGYQYRKLSVQTGVQWFSKRKILSPHINTLYSNFVDSDGYLNFDPVLLLNLHLRVNNIWRGFSCFLHVENMLNNEYYGQTINANWGSPKILQDLRRIDFGVDLKF